jgi:hypothetical protein
MISNQGVGYKKKSYRNECFKTCIAEKRREAASIAEICLLEKRVDAQYQLLQKKVLVLSRWDPKESGGNKEVYRLSRVISDKMKLKTALLRMRKIRLL